MNITKPQTYIQAFVLGADELQLLDDLLRQHTSSEEGYKVGYEVRLSNRSSINTDSIDEVIQIPNSPVRSDALR
jgi:hypothetical protein